MEYKKIESEINNIANDNLKKLAQLFPAAVKDGKVDFESLKEELGEFKKVDREKYELTWAGKQNAKKVALEDLKGRTLKYVPEDSKNPKTTENLYIEGDNLEVIKLLRQNYYGAIKMIYIDPPYNTGKDFVYNDNFTMSVEESELAEGNIDELGNRYKVNENSQNRYHANWLNMMYPRLKIAKDLLKDDGVILISIDDEEVDNLRKLCDEIFGSTNRVADLIWDLKSGTQAGHFTRSHEYILVFAKSKDNLTNFSLDSDESIIHGALKKISRANPESIIEFPIGFEYEGENAIFEGVLGNSEKEHIIDGKMIFENGKLKYPTKISAGWGMKNQLLSWINGEDTYDSKGQKVTRFYFNTNGILYYEKQRSIINPKTVINDVGSTKSGSTELKNLFDAKLFDFPKPVELIKRIASYIMYEKNSYALDFFSGSATTAQAVMQLNAEDGGTRKFIMAQIPEPTAENSEAKIAKYHTICDIGKERIRRAGDKIITENPEVKNKLDIGFKAFKVDNTNIKWNLINEANDQITTDTADYLPDLMDFVTDSKDIDVVYELMLRQNDVPLSSTLEVLSEIGERTYLYASSYLVCLETQITEELVDKLAALNPLPIKFIFRDSAFQDDIALKDETFRRLKALIEKNSGNTKKTYTVEFI